MKPYYSEISCAATRGFSPIHRRPRRVLQLWDTLRLLFFFSDTLYPSQHPASKEAPSPLQVTFFHSDTFPNTFPPCALYGSIVAWTSCLCTYWVVCCLLFDHWDSCKKWPLKSAYHTFEKLSCLSALNYSTKNRSLGCLLFKNIFKWSQDHSEIWVCMLLNSLSLLFPPLPLISKTVHGVNLCKIVL